MIKWDDLPRSDGKVKLKKKKLSLVDAFNVLIEAEDPLVKYLAEAEMFTLTHQSEFDVVQPYIPLKMYATHKDKENGNYVYFLFANHGPIYFCEEEVLENYKLNDISFFWNFSLPCFDEQPKECVYPHYFELSDDEDAIEDWSSFFNYDDIFETYGLNGAEGGYAGFVGMILEEKNKLKKLG